jgi:hypothetical protein
VQSFSLEPGSKHFSIQPDGSLYDIYGNILIRGLLHRFHVTNNVEALGPACFAGLPLGEITFGLHAQLRSIGEGAFHNSGLFSIKIPASVEVFGQGCFYQCDRLKKVEFEPNSRLRSIPKDTFAKCKQLYFVQIPAAVQYIVDGCFFGCPWKMTLEFEEGSPLAEQYELGKRGRWRLFTREIVKEV